MLILRDLGIQDYLHTFEKMKNFTLNRTDKTLDEIWFLEHPPVFTQGQAGKDEHILQKTNIPIIQSDRGGQITYHGPGQLIVYFLLDCKRNHLSIRQLVTGIENLVISILKEFDITGKIICGAPGVYVHDQKIASLGLRIKNNCSYHGLALNVDMDMKPFSMINPCGFKSMKMSQIKDWYPSVNMEQVSTILQKKLIATIKDEHLFQENLCTFSKT